MDAYKEISVLLITDDDIEKSVKEAAMSYLHGINADPVFGQFIADQWEAETAEFVKENKGLIRLYVTHFTTRYFRSRNEALRCLYTLKQKPVEELNGLRAGLLKQYKELLRVETVMAVTALRERWCKFITQYGVLA